MNLPKEAVYDAIVSATTAVVETMLDLPIEVVAQLDSGPETERSVLVSMIGLSGPWAGVGSLHCSAGLAAEIHQRMFMAEEKEHGVTDEVMDAVAEVNNMIVGNFKHAVAEQLGVLMMSIPTTIYGQEFVMKSQADSQNLGIRFRVGGYQMETHVALAPYREAATRMQALRPLTLTVR